MTIFAIFQAYANIYFLFCSLKGILSSFISLANKSHFQSKEIFFIIIFQGFLLAKKFLAKLCMNLNLTKDSECEIFLKIIKKCIKFGNMIKILKKWK